MLLPSETILLQNYIAVQMYFFLKYFCLCMLQAIIRGKYLKAHEAFIVLSPTEFYWAQNSLKVNNKTGPPQFLVKNFPRKTESINEKSLVAQQHNCLYCSWCSKPPTEVHHLHLLLCLTNAELGMPNYPCSQQRHINWCVFLHVTKYIIKSHSISHSSSTATLSFGSVTCKQNHLSLKKTITSCICWFLENKAAAETFTLHTATLKRKCHTAAAIYYEYN